MSSTMLVTECNICIHCILHICNIQCVIFVICHNIINNLCHFYGQMYVLCNVNILNTYSSIDAYH